MRLKPGVTLGLAFSLSLGLSACTTGSGDQKASFERTDGISRILSCKSTDTLVDSASQCLQDGAACYQINNGKWCTGERGNTCPAGSVAIPLNTACPTGNRCFRVSEDLYCMIS